MKISIITIIIIFMFSCEKEQKSFDYSQYHSSRTTLAERDKFNSKFNKLFKEAEQLEINSENEKKWLSAFWAMGLKQYRNEKIKRRIQQSLIDFKKLSYKMQRAMLEVIYGLYPNDFAAELYEIAQSTDNPKLFTMCCLHIFRVKMNQKEINQLLQSKIKKNLDWKEHPIIKMLENKINTNEQEVDQPNIADMLSAKTFHGLPMIYSFQRQNREYPGITVIRKSNRKFMRDDFGRIFSIQHLAKSNSNLPGYITNGNTPQGIYSIQGIDFSDNVFIGPAPTLQSRLPFEVNPEIYFHNEIEDTSWSIELYENLLPESWKEYFPINEAFYAGKAGRSEIIAHGTTINPDFYKDSPFYPLTPSLGCMTALELWDEKTGKCLHSDQVALINAWLSMDSKKGFLIVLELDDKKQPVILDEIISDILLAENKIK